MMVAIVHGIVFALVYYLTHAWVYHTFYGHTEGLRPTEGDRMRVLGKRVNAGYTGLGVNMDIGNTSNAQTRGLQWMDIQKAGTGTGMFGTEAKMF